MNNLLKSIVFLFISINAFAVDRVYEEGIWGICGAASPISYEASWAIPSSPNLQPCDGEVLVDKILQSCMKLTNGQNGIVVSNSFCADKQVPQEAFTSPAGIKILTASEYLVANGHYEKTCAVGSSIGSVALICDSGYSEQSGSCVQPSLQLSNISAEYVYNLTGTALTPAAIAVTSVAVPTISLGYGIFAENTNLATIDFSTKRASSYNVLPLNDLSAKVEIRGQTSSPVSELTGQLSTPSGSISQIQIPVVSSHFTTSILQSEFSNLSNAVNWVLNLVSSGFSTTAAPVVVKKGVISQLSNINSGGEDAPGSMVEYNGEIYFSAIKTGSIYKLFKYSPASNTITQVSNIRSGQSDDPSLLTLHNGELFFTAKSTAGVQKLFKINTAGTISQISNITGASSADGISSIVSHGGNLYFVSYNTSGLTRLFRYHDASSQILQTSNINSSNDIISDLTVYGEDLYFYSNSSVYRSESKLFRFNSGPGEGIVKISNTNGFNSNDNVSNLKVYNGYLYFSAYASSRSKLFRYDRASHKITQISNIRGDSYDDSPQDLIGFSGDLYFSAIDPEGSGYRYLFKYNTADGNITKISNVSNPKKLQIYKGELYFIGATPDSMYTKLFKYNKEKNLIYQVSNVKFGHEFGSQLFSLGQFLYYSAAGDVSSNSKIFKIENSD